MNRITWEAKLGLVEILSKICAIYPLLSVKDLSLKSLLFS